MARREFTEDEVEELVARVLQKSGKAPRPEFDRLKEQQYHKILEELAREKRHRVKRGPLMNSLTPLGVQWP